MALIGAGRLGEEAGEGEGRKGRVLLSLSLDDSTSSSLSIWSVRVERSRVKEDSAIPEKDSSRMSLLGEVVLRGEEEKPPLSKLKEEEEEVVEDSLPAGLAVMARLGGEERAEGAKLDSGREEVVKVFFGVMDPEKEEESLS